MSQEKLIRQGMLLQLEEKNALSARAKAGLYVLRGVFTDLELQLDPSRKENIYAFNLLHNFHYDCCCV